MRKTRSALDRFRLFYEYLPSDDQVFETVRRYRAEQRKKQKQEVEKIRDWLLSSPAVWRKVVANLRRVKR